MKENLVEYRTGSPRTCTLAWIAGLCVCAMLVEGCAEKHVKAKVRTYPWSTAAMVRPVIPEPVSSDSVDQQGDDLFADFELDVPPPPSSLVTTNGAPLRPRVPPTPAPPGNTSKFEAPQIVPQLTPQETEAAEQQTNLSLSIAERNIGATQGRALNPSQSDLASKVRSFISEAREAAHIGDWTRASNAAKKAQVLSEELARSL
jgi:hypothetical protein